ncbi:MAG: cyclase [Acidimicrobiaceae bacterium]|nr:cyclase [Acidimicrobiaceae bacterium]
MPFTDQFLDLSARVRNWGRWGDDDQLGTLNLITPEVVAAAADLVRYGRTIPLAVLLEEDGVQAGFVPGRNNPVRGMHAVNEGMDSDGDPDSFHTSDDHVTMGLQAGTHWDGLGHVSYSGRMYNGYEASTITDAGASRCGIEHLRSVCTRGVLLDVARAKGVDVLDCPYAITAADLDEAAAMGSVEVRSGDIVLVRTGRMSIYHRNGGLAYCLGPAGDGSNAGLSLSTVPWLHAHDVAAVANDTLAFEVYPSEADILAVHLLHLVDMGLTQGQNWDLEALSADCAADGVYEFFLAATPEPFVGAVGSPVAPVAIK